MFSVTSDRQPVTIVPHVLFLFRNELETDQYSCAPPFYGQVARVDGVEPCTDCMRCVCVVVRAAWRFGEIT